MSRNIKGCFCKSCQCLSIKVSASWMVCDGDLVVSFWPAAGNKLPWRRMRGSSKVVSTTVETGRLGKVPASMMRSIKACCFLEVLSKTSLME